MPNDVKLCFVSEGALLCQICNLIAMGLIQPWYPASSSEISVFLGKKSDGKKDKSVPKTAPKITTTGLDPDANSELRQALEVIFTDLRREL